MAIPRPSHSPSHPPLSLVSTAMAPQFLILQDREKVIYCYSQERCAEDLEVNEQPLRVESSFYGLDGEERTWTSLMML